MSPDESQGALHDLILADSANSRKASHGKKRATHSRKKELPGIIVPRAFRNSYSIWKCEEFLFQQILKQNNGIL